MRKSLYTTNNNYNLVFINILSRFNKRISRKYGLKLIIINSKYYIIDT